MFDSLRGRLIVSHLLVIAVVIVLTALTLVVLLRGYREQISEATLRQVAGPVGFRLNRISGASEAQPLLRFLQSSTTDVGVGAAFVNTAGEVLGSTEVEEASPLVGERFELPPVDSLSSETDRLFLGEHDLEEGGTVDYVAIPFPPRVRRASVSQAASPDDAPIALVLFAPQDTAADLIREDLAPRLMIAGGAGLIVALVVGGVFARWIYGPLGRLREATYAVAAGDLTTTVDETGPRETRQLARDFNLMTEEVAAGRQALRDFLLDASHELRTPLTSLRGFSAALSDGTIDDEEGRRRAGEIIQIETERLLRLVNDLSDLSRLESGEMRIEPEPIDALWSLDRVAELFGPAARRASATIDVDAEAGMALVHADPDRIDQVLSNLVDNAVRHVRQGGRIRIAARTCYPGFAEISVADDGPGIPAAELERVFDRHYRRARGNSGLGLAISRELVRAHGGEIWAESTEGVGTRFVFTLPFETSAPQ